MGNQFRTFNVKLYSKDEMNDYLRNSSEEGAMDEITPPEATLARVLINLNEVEMFMEASSVEAEHISPEDPKLDSVEVRFTSGGTLPLNETYESVIKIINSGE